MRSCVRLMFRHISHRDIYSEYRPYILYYMLYTHKYALRKKGTWTVYIVCVITMCRERLAKKVKIKRLGRVTTFKGRRKARKERWRQRWSRIVLSACSENLFNDIIFLMYIYINTSNTHIRALVIIIGMHLPYHN
jgi:hypothetical protein